MNIHLKSNQSGYIALISAVVISALLISMAFTLSFTNYFNRYNILDNEYKEISVGLAEACADMAILKLAEDAGYHGDEPITIDGKSCQIRHIPNPPAEPDKFLIETQAIVQNSYTNLQINVTRNADDIIIDSWEEIEQF